MRLYHQHFFLLPRLLHSLSTRPPPMPNARNFRSNEKDSRFCRDAPPLAMSLVLLLARVPSRRVLRFPTTSTFSPLLARPLFTPLDFLRNPSPCFQIIFSCLSLDYVASPLSVLLFFFLVEYAPLWKLYVITKLVPLPSGAAISSTPLSSVSFHV